ncbi:MAG: T9SS type A sorting domain-containing protein [bacterium]|nr:T9SS type A sorting domain-containing protein [bacterium]
MQYTIPQSSNVEIRIYGILGNVIETLVNEEKQAGRYEITWYANDLPSGIYFYQIKVGNYVETKKMILLK